MTQAVHIRPAKSTDAGAVGAVLSEFTQLTDWLPKVHTRAQDVAHAGQMIDRGWVTVTCQEQVVTGFLARETTTIHALYIAASHHRQGLGRALLNHAKAGVNRLSLWTFQANVPAQAFYRAEGFVEAERTNGAGNDEGLPDIRYLWQKETPL